MKRSFSFNENPVLFILRLFPQMLPGIEKVIVVYFSPDTQKLHSSSTRKTGSEYLSEELSLENSLNMFRKLRADAAPYSWMRNEDVPFEIISKEKVQLHIFNELDNNVLLIRIQNENDKLNDLYFVYFNQNLSNFGTVNINKTLSTENKTIIAHLIRNSIATQLSVIKEDKELFSELVTNTRSILNDVNRLNEDISKLREKGKEGIITMCQAFLNDLSRMNSRIYHLSDSAVMKLREYDGEPLHLKEILQKAARFAETFSMDRPASDITISGFHIIFNEPKEIKQKDHTSVQSGEVPVKYSKTLVLLDKLENAARSVKTKNKLLTSVNLGSEFATPISPPAITDALKKHKSKILFLFKEYPDKWEVIRSEFRPVQNLLNARPEPHQLTA
jgi:hypothetical protein